MSTEGVIYPELSYQIMQAVFEVHNQLGPGFLENIYEAALVRELELQGIPFAQQMPVQIEYKGRLIVNTALIWLSTIRSFWNSRQFLN